MCSLNSTVNFYFPFWNITGEIFSKMPHAACHGCSDPPHQAGTKTPIPLSLLAAATPVRNKVQIQQGHRAKMHSPDLPHRVSAALLSCYVSKDSTASATVLATVSVVVKSTAPPHHYLSPRPYTYMSGKQKDDGLSQSIDCIQPPQQLVQLDK